MYSPADQPLTEVAAEAYVERTCFKTGPPGTLGLELEYIPVQGSSWTAPVDHSCVIATLKSLSPLPAGGLVTFEPGGQVELSTRPAPDLLTLIRDAQIDLDELRVGLSPHDIVLVGTALDPVRPPRRILDHPRYAAMERHFDQWGPAGRTMMCSTASLQITVEAGAAGFGSVDDPHGYRARWALAHAMGPTLLATFANSPYRCGSATGWKSSRQAAWFGFDPSRTSSAFTPDALYGRVDIREAYARYALDAQLMLVRRENGDWSAPRGLTFRDWTQGAWRDDPGICAPTLGDLEYHLTTLFPPVRARGALELRYLDAQSVDHWRVMTAVVAALMDDPGVADAVLAAVGLVEDRWEDAARYGLADDDLAKSALSCMAIARESLSRSHHYDPSGALLDEVDDFIEMYTSRGRSPADDLLDDPSHLGTLIAAAETPERKAC